MLGVVALRKKKIKFDSMQLLDETLLLLMLMLMILLFHSCARLGCSLTKSSPSHPPLPRP